MSDTELLEHRGVNMTARTSALHNISELTPIHIEDTLGIFEALSSSSDQTYMVQFDPYTQQATCDCPAATKGQYTCWHVDLVGEAFERAIQNKERDEETVHWVLLGLSDEALLTTIRTAQERLKDGATDPKHAIVSKMGRRIWRSRRLSNEQQP